MKHGLRKALGPVWPALIKLKTSRPVQVCKVYLGYWPYRAQMRQGGRGMIVDVSSRVGMGALLAYLLRLHALAEDRGIHAHFVSSSPLYSGTAGEDFLAEYFERDEPPRHGRKLSMLATEWLLHKELPDNLPMERACSLFARHFRPRPSLQAIVERVSGDGGTFDLSIHFRGTDKFLETGNVEAETMLEALAPHLPDAGSGKRVFLATDDAAFGLAVRERFPRASFASFDLGELESGLPRHFSGMPAQDKALEALANIFLLSRAGICLRTQSYMSALARVANPDLQTKTINWPGKAGVPFPDSAIQRIEHERAQARA